MIYTCVECNRVKTGDKLPIGWVCLDDENAVFHCTVCHKEDLAEQREAAEEAEGEVGYPGLCGCRDYDNPYFDDGDRC